MTSKKSVYTNVDPLSCARCNQGLDEEDSIIALSTAKEKTRLHIYVHNKCFEKDFYQIPTEIFGESLNCNHCGKKRKPCGTLVQQLIVNNAKDAYATVYADYYCNECFEFMAGRSMTEIREAWFKESMLRSSSFTSF